VVTNFIFASLCDNDFGTSMLKGITEISRSCMEQESNLTEEDFKYFLIHYVVFDMIVKFPSAYRKREWKDIEHTKNYLEEKMKISYLTEPPNVDHDGGSVVYDINLDYAWLT